VVLEVDTTYAADRVREYVYVWTNDPSQPKVRLTMETDVIPVFNVKPKGWFSFKTSRGNPASQILFLIPQEDGVAIEHYFHNLGNEANVFLSGPDEKKQYTLTLDTQATRPGQFIGWIRLTLRNSRIKEFVIRASILVEKARDTGSRAD
jgi:hypothetical protein